MLRSGLHGQRNQWPTGGVEWSMAKKRFKAWSTSARSATAALVLATATGCTVSGHDDALRDTDTNPAPTDGATQTSDPTEPVVDVEAVEVLGTGGMLVAGRLPHAQKPQLWRCPALTAISRCERVASPGLSRSEYVDDIATAGRATYWVLSIDVDRQRSFVHITTNGGHSWVQHAAPSRGLAAGSRGTIQVFGDRQALLIQYWANGPLAQQYRTDDAGASWQPVSDIDLG